MSGEALPSGALTQARADVLTTLPNTAVIKSVTRTSDSAGGWSESLVAVTGGTVACRLDPVALREYQVLKADKPSLKVIMRATFPYNAPLETDSIVTVGGTDYQVVHLIEAHSWNVSVRAVLGVEE